MSELPHETTSIPDPPLARFFPGYFAFVMATGVVALGCSALGVAGAGEVLYVVAAAGYVVIAALTLARLLRYPDRFRADLLSHAKGFAFTTAVAATEVMGTSSALVFGWWTLATVLWVVGVALWVVLLYPPLIAVVLRVDKPEIGVGINGTWFLLTVSTQSISVLGALLAPRLQNPLVAFVAVTFFGLGMLLYVVVMTMVFTRWTFHRLSPDEEDPPIWIAAGAVAITTLAGSNLLLGAGADPLLQRVAPAVELLTLMAWATATFWLPLMVAIGVWRHVVHRVPLRYHPSYWSLVFPIGMYSLATARMRTALDLGFLAWVPPVALGWALLAWLATFAGLVHTLVRRPEEAVR
ncbi:C4-dicarboxylate transporter [Pseudonocardia sulfidoxydans NBRC 16205]|uniref:C4-dicarboxylate transporter n=1 Tax=Pseudonocardia sulfidoxydans NBRC 16205 TaxID=1223511 RepID=A0A511DI49_9PSEU|nr:tellurite resistance/C4-dicarboxylate transporter family protein [Pseudonocardia sulfidoxydans]GEL23434.1 C4-dicarboxylate transporter [Pseudonocardia sulfidoxydans NBRC 16205]